MDVARCAGVVGHDAPLLRNILAAKALSVQPIRPHRDIPAAEQASWLNEPQL